METYKKIFKTTSLFGGVQGFSILLNLIRTKLVALLLGPSGIGLNSIYNETRELIHSTTNLGLDVSGIRGISQSYETWLKAETTAEKHEKQILIGQAICLLRSWVILFALFGTLICLLLSEPLSYFSFGDYDHTWSFVFLSPVIGLSTLICGELAVLKATRHIRMIALVTIINVVLTLLTTIPLYYFFGLNGIIPAFILLYITQFIAILSFSYRLYPPTFIFRKKALAAGFPMLILGLSFALTGMINHGAQLAIRTFINNHGGIEMVGLFNAGYTLFIMLGSVAFASLDSYFFPHLSGVFKDVQLRRQSVLKQIKVTLTFITPLIIILFAILGWIIPLLFSHEFDQVIPMARVAILALFFRAIYLPLAYIPLSAGDSKTYLILEFISALILSSSIIVGYSLYGLLGAGFGLLFSNLVDMSISLFIAKIKYKI